MKRLQKSVAVIATLLMSSSTLGNVALADTVPISKSGSATMSLQVPSNASKVYENDKNHVKYQVNNAVQVQDNSGDTLVAPETVDSQITSTDGSSSSGTTTTTVDLSQAQIETASTQSTLGVLSPFINFFGGVIAHAATKSNIDSSLGVKITVTSNWTKNDSLHRTMTNVSGSYARSDGSIVITYAVVGAQEQSAKGNYIKYFYPGSASKWSYNTGFPKLMMSTASSSSGTYRLYLHRGASNWNVFVQAWGWAPEADGELG